MNVYPVTDVDRDLLLAGADLEALLAEREKERLEPDEQTETRPNVRTVIRLETEAPGPREGRDAGD
jgi:hypothetical protein